MPKTKVESQDPLESLKQAVKETNAKLEKAEGDDAVALEQQRTSLANQLQELKGRQKAERKQAKAADKGAGKR